MREDVYRRLTRTLWLRRAKTWGLAALVGALCVAVAAYLTELRIGQMDPSTETLFVEGTVVSSRRLPARANISLAHVRLDDGQEVDADSQLPVALVPDERISVRRIRHASGKVTFRVDHVLQ